MTMDSDGVKKRFNILESLQDRPVPYRQVSPLLCKIAKWMTGVFGKELHIIILSTKEKDVKKISQQNVDPAFA